MKTVISKLVYLILLLILFPSCDKTDPQPVETGLITNLEMEIDGVTRYYDIYIPSYYTRRSKMPLLLDLHGATLSKEDERGISNFDVLAEEKGFVVAFPAGLQRYHEPPIDAVGWSWAYKLSADQEDLDFLGELIDQLVKNLRLDKRRVYVTGLSQGGYMTYSMACKYSDKIAAIAVVSGRMTPSQLSECQPERQVPVLHIHGTSDLVVPFSVTPYAMEFWANKGGCGLEFMETDLPDIDATDNSTVTVRSYCSGNGMLEFMAVNGGGHSWPGSTSALFEHPLAQALNNDISASEEIWDFLSNHKLPDF